MILTAIAAAVWSFGLTKDVLTDATVVKARTMVDHVQFTITCRTDERAPFFIRTFDAQDHGRPIHWFDEFVGGEIVDARQLKVRWDSERVEEATLVQRDYLNAGRLVGASFYDPKLPKERLIVAGLFPDHVIVFDFASLQVDDRRVLAATCGLK